MRRYLVSIAVLLTVVLPASAGGPGFEVLPFLRLSRDPSALTGGAAQVFASKAYSVFSNPALAFASGERGDMAVSYARWGASGSNEIDVCGAYGFSDRFSVGAGYSNSLGVSFEGFTPSDMIAGMGASVRVTDAFTVGANVRYASSKFTEEYSYGAVSGDLFVAMRFSGLTATAGVSTLGPAVQSVSTASYSQPSSAAFGLGYGGALGEALDARVQLTADYYLSGALSAGAGAEMIVKDLLSLRLGYNYGGESVIPSYASAGIGLNFSGLKINAAFLMPGKDIGNSLCVGLGFGF